MPATPAAARYFLKGAIALIVIKTILAVGGNKEVFVTVIVVIAHARALSPGRIGEAGMRGYIGERAIVIVMKEMAGGMLVFLILPGSRSPFTRKMSGQPSLS